MDIVGDIYATTYRRNNNVVWGGTSATQTTTQTFDAFQSSNYLPENTADTPVLVDWVVVLNGLAVSWPPMARFMAFLSIAPAS